MQTTIVKPPLLLHVIKRRKVSFNDEEVGVGWGGGRVECTLRHNLCTGIRSSSFCNERFQLFKQKIL